MNFFSDNENFERGPPRHAGGNGNQGINFVWPYTAGMVQHKICDHYTLDLLFSWLHYCTAQ